MGRALTDAQVDAVENGFGPVVWLLVGQGPDDDHPLRVPVIGGQLIEDAGSQERWTLNATVPIIDGDGVRWAPGWWDDPLVPDDAYLSVFYGVGVGDWITLNPGLWLDQARTRRPDGVLELTAYSTATRVSQAGFPDGDRRWTGDTATVIHDVVLACLGWASVTVDNPDGLTGPDIPAGYAFDGDPWDVVEQLADAAGWDVFWWGTTLVIRAQPTGTGLVEWDFLTGEGGTIVAYDTALTRAPNVVRLAFQDPDGTAPDVVGEAVAPASASPFGPYGWYRTDETRTGRPVGTEADDAASSWLARAGGLLRTINFDASPHPGLRVGDTIMVRTVDDAEQYLRTTYVGFPLTPGDTMHVENRATPWGVST